ncbi:MAG: ACT domain-containing protein [Peptococcaceae bacterium]|nr:ACT domain-containing protein [Peptococcaceae bacterium]MDH7525241.1 ACT domain-containing protein [Peptococcaceae bacterium]
MNSKRSKQFYMVSKDILPEAILKTAVVKEILTRGEALTVNEAVEMVGISRSAFYKYRDGIFPFYQAAKEKIVTFSLILEHRTGVLSNVLNTVAGMKGNVLTINQGLPLQGLAVVTLSIDTLEVTGDMEELIEKLQEIDGVKRVEIVAHS